MTTTQTQLRRDTDANLALATPVAGEPAYNSTKKRLHMGDASMAGGIPHLNYLDEQAATFLTASVGGTANAITLTLAPGPSGSYANAQRIRFKATATNTGAATANTNGIGTTNIKKIKDGSIVALSGNEIVSGGWYYLDHDGTQYLLLNPSYVTVSSGGLVLLNAQTISSAVSSVDFTSLLSASYDNYLVEVNDLFAASSGSGSPALSLRMSSSNGSSYDTSTTLYSSTLSKASSSTVTNQTPAGIPGMRLHNNNTSVATATSPLNGEVKLLGMNGTANPKAAFASFITSSGGTAFLNGGGEYAGTSAVNAFRFLLLDIGNNVVNIASGKFRLYGLANS